MRRALAVLAAALLVTACRVDTTVTVTVEADGSGTVAVTVTADAEVVSQAPGLADDLRLDDVAAAGWTVDGPTATAEGGLTVTVIHPFATVEEATTLLASLSGTDGPLHDVALARAVTDDAVTTTLTGRIFVAGGVNAFADPELLAAIGGSPYANDIAATGLTPADVVTFTFVANLPGDPTPAADGTVPPMTWTVPIDGTTADVAATAVAARGGGGGGIWGTVADVALIALIVWCVLAVAFIAFVMTARRNRARRRSAHRRT